MSTPHVTVWGWFWLAWVLVGLGVEVYWLGVNTANTLSRQVWGVERMDFAHPLDFAEWTPLHWIIGCSLILFLAWLIVHLPFGQLR